MGSLDLRQAYLSNVLFMRGFHAWPLPSITTPIPLMAALWIIQYSLLGAKTTKIGQSVYLFVAPSSKSQQPRRICVLVGSIYVSTVCSWKIDLMTSQNECQANKCNNFEDMHHQHERIFVTCQWWISGAVFMDHEVAIMYLVLIFRVLEELGYHTLVLWLMFSFLPWSLKMTGTVTWPCRIRYRLLFI